MFKIRNVKTSKVDIKHQSINLYLTWTVNVTCGFIFLYTPVNEYSIGGVIDSNITNTLW
jgi:hypothetical protein